MVAHTVAGDTTTRKINANPHADSEPEMRDRSDREMFQGQNMKTMTPNEIAMTHDIHRP